MKKWGSILRDEGYLADSNYVTVFDMVNRADFVPERFKKDSDSDEPIPIPLGQTQSAPHMNALLVTYAGPREGDVALEVGTGSGYLTTILSFLVKKVVSIEREESLSKWANKNIRKYTRNNIDLIIGNINKNCLKNKFDIIISTASFKREPNFLGKMIKPGGRIIFPLGSYPPQRLIRYRDDKREELGYVAFLNIKD